ncbi:hypothetical protein M408DRAFT_170482 [Serendipita vermifera MAFF 305830]|uniref:Uncharacterized protein n=1 Tax=Serendipita vermifera MAFF 305830 TaxID=933852 RepID=A0A0C3B6V6_SERVB|nr:hypothetical protein M408DRAFT_170482 [Serendipita vermifera MAFF 305830]
MVYQRTLGSPISVLPELDPPSSTEPSATPVLETSTILSTGDYWMGAGQCMPNADQTSAEGARSGEVDSN